MQPVRVDLGIIDEKIDCPPASSKEIRNSMNCLPQWLQGFLTWLTTQPVSGQAYPVRSSSYQVLTGFLSLLCGVAMSVIAFQLGDVFYALLPFSWIVTVSGMRKLQVVIYHHCSHGTVFKSKWANLILGEVISIFLVIKDFRTYKRDHMAHHSSNKLLTYEDETAQDLGEIGLLPGVARNLLWQRLLISFISPVAHTRWMLNRIRNCFLSLNFLHNLMAICFWISLIVTVNYYQLWNQFIVVWLFPLTILYHISRILRLVAEHRWPTAEINNARGKMFVCLSTIAVFNGEALPPRSENYFSNFFRILIWLLKIIFIHLFARVFVLVGDTPCHDYHHRRPTSREWGNYILAREDDKSKGCPGYPVNYAEIWGLFNAVNTNLKSLSEA